MYFRGGVTAGTTLYSNRMGDQFFVSIPSLGNTMLQIFNNRSAAVEEDGLRELTTEERRFFKGKGCLSVVGDPIASARAADTRGGAMNLTC